MGTYYSYNCQACGKRQTAKSKVRRCRYCSITLCWRCSTRGFCPTHNQVLTDSEKSELIKADRLQSTLICSACCIGIIFMIAFSVALSSYTEFSYLIGIGGGILLCCGITIPSYKWSNRKFDEVKSSIDNRLAPTSQILTQKPSISSMFPMKETPSSSSFFPTKETPSSVAFDRPQFCPKCGTTLSPGDLFCPDCGFKIEEQ